MCADEKRGGKGEETSAGDIAEQPNAGVSPATTCVKSATTSNARVDGSGEKIVVQSDDLVELKSLQRYTEAYVIPRPERIWRTFLGASALLEMLSYVLPYLFSGSEDDAVEGGVPLNHKEEKALGKSLLFFLNKEEQAAEEVAEQPLWQWFDENRYKLGVLFSVLWFFHAFVSAGVARQWALRRKDREVLLSQSGGDAADERGASADGKGDDDDAKKAEGTIRAYDEVAYSVGGSWGVFFVKALWFLLLLPVGFYMLSLLDIREIFLGDGGEDDTTAEELALKASDDVATFSNRVITKETKYCLAYAAFVYAGKTVSNIVGAAVRVRSVALAKTAVARSAKFSIRHPRRATRRLRNALRILRWVKYLLPLIGTGNKLLGNSVDLTKKYRQTRAATKARHIRRKLWTELDPEERKVQAAVVIQKNFRAHRVRRTERALRMLRMQKRDAAVLRIQSVLRRRAASARSRVLRKKQELRQLQMRQLEMKKKRTYMSADERRRIYQLQDQLGIEFQNKGPCGMLLRPNTRFAVTWKVLFVICVVLEITQLAVKPKLAQYKDKETGQPLSVNLILEHVLVPDPIDKWPQCQPPKKARRAQDSKKGRHVKMPFGKNVTGGGPSCGDHDGLWYCHKPYTVLSTWYSEAVRFIINQTLILVGVICFMDVLVTFFTGELDEETGTLRPKPFVTRWILPGIVLQLLVNPMMLEVTAALHKLRRGIHYVGPARVWRWTKAFVVPAFTAFVTWFEWSVWRRFVKKENKNLVH